MEDQHKVVAGHVEHVRELLASWRHAPSGSEMPEALDELRLALGQHLDEEEAEVLPLIREHITAAEWQEGGDAAFAKFTNNEKLIAWGRCSTSLTGGSGWVLREAAAAHPTDVARRRPTSLRHATWRP